MGNNENIILASKQASKQASRNICIDLIRGVAVFLVIWGHCIQFLSAGSFDYFDNKLFQFIYSFHMPLFALISGYLFWNSVQKRSTKELLISRAKGLLYPIVLWGTIYFLLRAVISTLQHEAVNSWWNTVGGTFLWFLWAILFSSISVMLVEKYVKPVPLKIVVLIVLFIAVGFLPNGMYTMFLYPFFTVGFYFKKYEDKVDRRLGWIAVPVFIVMVIFYNRDYFIYTTGISVMKSSVIAGRQLFIDAYRYLIGFSGSISVIMLVRSCADKLPGRIKTIVATMGRYSLEIYILQCFAVCWIMPTVWQKIVGILRVNPLTKIMPLYNFIITPIVAVVAVLIIVGVIKLIGKREKLRKIVFGR